MSRNYFVTIQRLTDERDAIGQPLTTWVDVGTDFADIRYLGGLEAIKAGAETSIAKVSIRIGYRTDINSGMRILEGETAYNILAVLPDMASKRHVDLACEAVN